MKRHLKRNFTPASWMLGRKENKFIIKPNPGAHPIESGLPLNIVMMKLGLAKTKRDSKNILKSKEVLIDGKARTDLKFVVGIMDVISLPKIKKHHIMILDSKGRLNLKEISEDESKIKLAKVLGKRAVKKGKTQISLHDGKNILTDEKVKVGETVVLELPSCKIKKVLEFKPGVPVYLLKGKHSGDLGVLKEIEGKEIAYEKGKEKIETLKEYALAIGEKEPLIKIENGK